jgi:hypothetical protein
MASYYGVLSRFSLGDGLLNTPVRSTLGVKRIDVGSSGVQVSAAPQRAPAVRLIVRVQELELIPMLWLAVKRDTSTVL